MSRVHFVNQFLAVPQSLFPARFPPAVILADHRPADAVRIIMQIGEGGAFRADVAAAPDIVLVRANALDLSGLERDLDTTHAFAQRTGAKVGFNVRTHIATGCRTFVEARSCPSIRRNSAYLRSRPERTAS